MTAAEGMAKVLCQAIHPTRWEYRAISHSCDECGRSADALAAAGYGLLADAWDESVRDRDEEGAAVPVRSAPRIAADQPLQEHAMITAEEHVLWRRDAEVGIHDLCDHEPPCDTRILILLDELEKAEAERDTAMECIKGNELLLADAEADNQRLRDGITALADESECLLDVNDGGRLATVHRWHIKGLRALLAEDGVVERPEDYLSAGELALLASEEEEGE